MTRSLLANPFRLFRLTPAILTARIEETHGLWYEQETFRIRGNPLFGRCRHLSIPFKQDGG